MESISSRSRHAALSAVLLALVLTSQANAQSPRSNSGSVDADGTVHFTRVLPVPASLSPEAKATLLPRTLPADIMTVAGQRSAGDKFEASASEVSRKTYPVNIKKSSVANVPVLDVTPLTIAHPDWVLLCLHGGGFVADWGSLTESIPMANLVQARVISVLYRLAPESPYPAQVDDAVAVYRDLLKTYKPNHIVIYGTSAGAVLTGEVAVHLKQMNLPLPAALGVFSGAGDFTDIGESGYMYNLGGLNAAPPYAVEVRGLTVYVGTHDPKEPGISANFADLHGMPPTLFLTSGRDALLSGTTIMQRAFLRAGVDARLVVFEGLTHAFWNDSRLPESREAYGYMATFFTQQLSK